MWESDSRQKTICKIPDYIKKKTRGDLKLLINKTQIEKTTHPQGVSVSTADRPVTTSGLRNRVADRVPPMDHLQTP